MQLVLQQVVVLEEQLHLRRFLRLGDGPLRLAQFLLEHGAPRRRISQGCKIVKFPVICTDGRHLEKITALLLPALFLESIVLVLELDEGILKGDTDELFRFDRLCQIVISFLPGFFENLPRLKKALPLYPRTTY